MNIAEMNNQEKKSNEGQNDVTKKNKNKNYNNFENDEKFQDNIITLQESIQKISNKIEEDKMNLRLLQERHIKKQSEYNELAGKPAIKSREQKVNEMKAKMQKLKTIKFLILIMVKKSQFCFQMKKLERSKKTQINVKLN